MSKHVPLDTIELCEICAIQEKKYKCPACNLKYCSLGCYNGHKPSCNLVFPLDEFDMKGNRSKTHSVPATEEPVKDLNVSTNEYAADSSRLMEKAQGVDEDEDIEEISSKPIKALSK